MKILAGSLTYPLPNGVSSSINESIDGFLEAGHQIYVVSPDYGTGKARPEHYYVPASAIGRAVTGYFGRDERTFGLGASTEIRRLIRELRPDAFWLHTLTWAPNAFERIMLKSKLPKVLTYHTMVELYGRQFAGAIGEQRMINRSVEVANAVNRIITPSHFMASRLINFGVTKPIVIIPSGIEPIRGGYTKAELAIKFHFPPNATVFIFVGRVVKEKNIDGLLKMMRLVVKTDPNVVLLLVGPGEIDEMKEEAAKLGITRNVFFTDQLSPGEARRCYKGADIFVFASQSETQGLVVGEAMSAGLPVVALDSPVRQEVYPESVAVVTKTIPKLAQAALELVHDKKRRVELSELGRDFVAEHFSKKTMIEKQVSVFEQLIDGNN